MRNEKLKIVQCVLVFLLTVTIALSAVFLCRTMNTCTERICNASGSERVAVSFDAYYLEQDILSMYYAEIYLNMSEDDLLQMIESGRMEGTYFQAPDGSYRFVRENLYQWCLEQSGIKS